MNAVCLDDECFALKNILLSLEEIPEIQHAEGFTEAEECLEFLKEKPVEIAFLDIDLNGDNGLVVAKQVKEIRPETQIIFLTGYSEYAVEAFKQHVSGYLLKPASVEDIRKEILHAQATLEQTDTEPKTGIQIQTFGNFEVFVNGEPIAFSRNKSKEVLAYLVDRRGASLTKAEIAAVLWEDGRYDRSRQKQLHVFVNDLIKALEAADAAHIVIKKRQYLALVKDHVECDYYAFLEGDPQAVNQYMGEYMSNYWWGEFTIGELDQKSYG